MLRVMVMPITQQMTSTRTNTTSPAIRIISRSSCARSALRLKTVETTADTRVNTASSRSEVRPGVLQSNAGTVANHTTSVSNRLAAGGNAGEARVLFDGVSVGWSIPTSPRLGTSPARYSRVNGTVTITSPRGVFTVENR